jgi:hypothetical protein
VSGALTPISLTMDKEQHRSCLQCLLWDSHWIFDRVCSSELLASVIPKVCSFTIPSVQNASKVDGPAGLPSETGLHVVGYQSASCWLSSLEAFLTN